MTRGPAQLCSWTYHFHLTISDLTGCQVQVDLPQNGDVRPGSHKAVPLNRAWIAINSSVFSKGVYVWAASGRWCCCTGKWLLSIPTAIKLSELWVPLLLGCSLASIVCHGEDHTCYSLWMGESPDAYGTITVWTHKTSIPIIYSIAEATAAHWIGPNAPTLQGHISFPSSTMSLVSWIQVIFFLLEEHAWARNHKISFSEISTQGIHCLQEPQRLILVEHPL